MIVEMSNLRRSSYSMLINARLLCRISDKTNTHLPISYCLFVNSNNELTLHCVCLLGVYESNRVK